MADEANLIIPLDRSLSLANTFFNSFGNCGIFKRVPQRELGRRGREKGRGSKANCAISSALEERERQKRSLSNLCDSSARIRVEYLRRRRVCESEREREQFFYIEK